MIKTTRVLEIDLRSYAEHYPCGAVLYKCFQENVQSELLDGQYCDTLQDFKEFIDRNKSIMDIGNTELRFRIDPDDIDTSNVMDMTKDIAEYIKALKAGGREYGINNN